MKHYNINNYIRYKNDVDDTIKRIPHKEFHEYTRNELVTTFLPLVENLARKFATSQQASGVMAITDLIQEGSLNLIKAVDRIEWSMINESEDPEKTLKSFLSKRIKGGIRRAIDINRGQMRLPEHVTNNIRKNFGKDKKAVAMFFNSIFLSIDASSREDDDMFLQIEDKSEPYNQQFLNMYLTSLLKQHLTDKKAVAMFFNSIFLSIDASSREDDDMFLQIEDKSEPYNQQFLNMYLTSLLKQHLTDKEFHVLRLSYGLDCEKHSAKQIAKYLEIEGSGAYVRVSQLKKQAVDKLIENVDHSQVLDIL